MDPTAVPESSSKRPVMTVVFWLVIVLSGMLLWSVVNAPKEDLPELAYSDFLKEVEAGRIAEVEITGDLLTGKRQDGSRFRAVIPANHAITLDALKGRNVNIRFKSARQEGWLQTMLSLLPLLILAALWLSMIRRMQGQKSSGTSSLPGWLKR